MALDTWRDDAANSSLTAERSLADAAILSAEPTTSETIPRSRSPICRMASASTWNSRGIRPVVTGRRSPLPNRSAAVTSRTSGPSTQRSVNAPTTAPASAVATSRCGGDEERYQRACDRAKRERADDGTDERRGDQHQPEHDLALASERRQALADPPGLFGLARRRVAHEPRQLRDLRACADR